MPLESIICRRRLDEERGNPFICECPMCREANKTEELKGDREKEMEDYEGFKKIGER
jgi:hypothetical protein